MSNPNLTRMIQQTIYDLKMKFGEPVSVYRVVDSETDYKTGDKSIETIATQIRNAIVLPEDEGRHILQAVNYISASKAFTSLGGGQWVEGQRGFIFDAADLRDYQPSLTDWILFEEQRYDVQSIEKLATNAGWLVIAKHVKGQPSGGSAVVNVSQSTGLNQSAAGE